MSASQAFWFTTFGVFAFLMFCAIRGSIKLHNSRHDEDEED